MEMKDHANKHHIFEKCNECEWPKWVCQCNKVFAHKCACDELCDICNVKLVDCICEYKVDEICAVCNDKIIHCECHIPYHECNCDPKWGECIKTHRAHVIPEMVFRHKLLNCCPECNNMTACSCTDPMCNYACGCNSRCCGCGELLRYCQCCALDKRQYTDIVAYSRKNKTSLANALIFSPIPICHIWDVDVILTPFLRYMRDSKHHITTLAVHMYEIMVILIKTRVPEYIMDIVMDFVGEYKMAPFQINDKIISMQNMYNFRLSLET